MKILYLTYHGFSDASGISKKILAQVEGLRQNGHDVHLCYYDFTPDGHRCRFIDDRVICDYGKGVWAALRQRVSYDCIFDYCAREGIQLVYARSFHNASPWLIHLFDELKSIGIRSVTEIPTYPYDKEYETLPLKYRMGLWVDRIFRRRLVSRMEAIVTFSSVKKIFGKRTINISNGVDFSKIAVRERQGMDSGKQINIIGVAEVHPWHGFDRMIAGIGEYYKNGGEKNVCFHIVGGVGHNEMYGTDKVPGFKPLIDKYGISEHVVFHGQLFGDALDKVFAKSSFAVGSLARHRSGVSEIKTLKNREYASRGLPFIYSENDADFDDRPYVFKVPADESPVDVAAVLNFMQGVSMSSLEIRASIAHLSWKRQMQIVIDELEEKR